MRRAAVLLPSTGSWRMRHAGGVRVFGMRRKDYFLSSRLNAGLVERLFTLI